MLQVFKHTKEEYNRFKSLFERPIRYTDAPTYRTSARLHFKGHLVYNATSYRSGSDILRWLVCTHIAVPIVHNGVRNFVLTHLHPPERMIFLRELTATRQGGTCP